MSTEHVGDEANELSHSPHEQWDELAVGYAMNALEPDELERFVDHLVMMCPSCRRSISDTAEVGAALSAAVLVPEPSEGLRSSVLAAALAARPAAQLSSVPSLTADDLVPILGDAPRRPVAPVDELAERRNRKLGVRATWLASAVAAVVIAVLAVTSVSAINGRRQQAASASRATQALDVLSAGSATTVPLTDDSGATVATVVARKGTVTVVSRGLKANSANNIYVLWGIAKQGGPLVALGDFSLTSSKVQTQQVAADARGAYSTMNTFGVSLEPGHQPPSKPSKILALGNS